MKLPSLDLLSALVVVAESPNLIEAAHRLGISQPALSMQLQKLERSLPQPIFGIEGKRKILTRYGRALYRASRRHLARLEVSVDRLNRVYASPESLTLTIGARRDFIHRVAPLIQFPGRIVFRNLPPAEAIEGLLSHSLDLAIHYQVPDSSELIAKALFTHGVRLTVHQKWLQGKKLTSELAKDPSFLTKTPALFYRGDGPLLGQWVESCGVQLKDLKCPYVCEDWTALMRLVETGAGWSIIPADIEARDPAVETCEIPAAVIAPVTYFALYHRELRKIPAYQNFLKFPI